jgi:hypothetical protein
MGVLATKLDCEFIGETGSLHDSAQIKACEDPSRLGKVCCLFAKNAPPLIISEGNSAAGTITDVYTDFRNPMYFKFHEGRMIGTGALSANDASRFRATLSAISEQVPEFNGLSVPEAEKVRDKLKGFTNNLVKIGNINYKRHEIINHHSLIQKLNERLESQNDPIRQALRQAEHQYPQIPIGAFRRLETAILESFHPQEIREIYKQREVELKNFSKLLPVLVRLYL